MEKRKKRGIWIVVILIAAAIAATVFFIGRGEKQVTVNTTLAEVKTLEQDVMATGYVQPVDKVDVGTQVSGVIEKIYVDFNSEVKQGDLLAELDKQTLREKMTQARASVTSAESDLVYAQQNYDRSKRLYEAKAATQVTYEDAVNKLEKAKTSYENAKANLQQADVNYGYAEIRSPINGVILDRAVNTGQTVASSFNTPTLFTIAEDLTKMQVEADIDEADIGRIKEGQKVTFTVDAYNADVFSGTVNQIRLQPTVTSNVVTYTVIIEAPNPEQKLFPGMTANITIITDSQTGLTVPVEATNFNPSDEVMKLLNIARDENAPASTAQGAAPQRRDGNNSMRQGGNGGQRPQGTRNGSGSARQRRNIPATDSEGIKEATVWIKRDGHIIPQKITTGTSDGINVIVHSGLEPGQEVILSASIEKKAKGQPTNIMPTPRGAGGPRR